jgi:hypothetical protein
MSGLLDGKLFIKITELDPATDFVGEDEFVFVQGGTTLKLTGQSIADSVTAIGNLASKGYVDTLVDSVVDSAPGTLNTLRELAFALNDDENFASHIISTVNGKLASSDFGSYFDSAFAAKNTYHLVEGSNLYFTNERAINAIGTDPSFTTVTLTGPITGATQAVTKEYVDTTTSAITLYDTDGLPEGAINKYYTDARARAAFSAGTGISITNGVITATGGGSGGGSYTLPTASTSVLGGVKVDGTTIVIDGNGTISASTNPTPTFTSVTTTDLNVKNVTFTGTGAVTITSGNDLNFVAAGNVTLNGEPTISLTRLKSVLAASADFADFKSRIASL